MAALLAVAALTGFVTTLDNTIIAAAAPSIGRELGLSLASLQWISIAYMLPYAGLLLPAGRLLDRFGRRRLVMAGCAVFAAGAVLGGVARSPELLLAARVVQGVAAAFVVPGTLSLIRTELPERRRATAIAAWTAALAAALALGPWLGGVLAEYLHWSWIFYSNLPFAAAALVLLARTPRERHAPVRGSWSGLVTNRVFAGSNALVLLWGLGISGIVFFTPLAYQESLGLGPADAALPLVVVAAGVIVTTPFVPMVSRALGPRHTVALGLLVLAVGLLQLAVVHDETTMAPRLLGLVLAGVGSAATAPLTTHALDQVGTGDSGTASGVLTTTRELSSALGVALIGAVLTAVAGNTGGAEVATGYTAALVVAAVLQLAGAALALVVLRPRPERLAVAAGRR
ncbi:MFS transporter [Actinophytocola algeriensis]|uniref:MFS family permease n=1 Tax=Actinophytocola algeriensis TaxID=1768010 RepID=A0A7W7Q8E0_9PSEU|nr:MFS transporter [Actinophytocola algeriensis]MBB4908738.1 MFS family permease [Actinophytocola algeriensis]MBE1474875.1 MFS family permease [Actinophytocola algeriensis]